jgi:hypothetical protein
LSRGVLGVGRGGEEEGYKVVEDCGADVGSCGVFWRGRCPVSGVCG